MPTEDAYTIAVDGPGVTLDSVDPVEALSVAIEYLRLLERVRDHLQLPLRFSGLKAVPGSAGLQTTLSDPAAFAPVLALAEQLVGGEIAPPKSLRGATKSAQAAIRNLPQGHVAKLTYGERTKVLLPRPSPAPQLRFEYLTLRAEVVGVGGADTPRAKFREPSEGTISVEVTAEQAREIGARVYHLAEVALRVARDLDGRIDDASLISFTPVSQGDAWPAWREWFHQNAHRWDEIEDIESELENGENAR